MKTVTSDHVVYKMAKENAPAARAASGETVVFETLDCFGCQITASGQKLESINWDRINPATGPLYVDGAVAGDILKVEILDIEVVNPGVMVAMPGEGVFGELLREESSRLMCVEGDTVKLAEGIFVPLAPMIGVIGTAPEGEGISTGTPGAHGGNMDCKRITKGTVLYLPVAVDGALLAMGDLHAAMGDGEIGVCGVEIPGKVTVRISVVKDEKLPVPFLVGEEQAAAVFSAETMELAAKGAAYAMKDFLMMSGGKGLADVNMLLSAAGNLCFCQVVDPLVTCRMEFPTRLITGSGYQFP